MSIAQLLIAEAGRRARPGIDIRVRRARKDFRNRAQAQVVYRIESIAPPRVRPVKMIRSAYDPLTGSYATHERAL